MNFTGIKISNWGIFINSAKLMSGFHQVLSRLLKSKNIVIQKTNGVKLCVSCKLCKLLVHPMGHKCISKRAGVKQSTWNVALVPNTQLWLWTAQLSVKLKLPCQPRAGSWQENSFSDPGSC